MVVLVNEVTPLTVKFVALLLKFVADAVSVVAPFRFIEDPDIRIPQLVGLTAHRHRIPLEAPVPFETSTVSPRATNGFN